MTKARRSRRWLILYGKASKYGVATLKLEVLVSAGDGSLEVAQDGVHPCEGRQFTRLALVRADERVGATSIDDACKAVQSIAQQTGRSWRVQCATEF